MEERHIRHCDFDSSIVVTESWNQLKPSWATRESFDFNDSSAFLFDDLLQPFRIFCDSLLQKRKKEK